MLVCTPYLFYAQLAPLVLRALTESQLITRIRGAAAALSLEQMTACDTRRVLLYLFQQIHAIKATTERSKAAHALACLLESYGR